MESGARLALLIAVVAAGAAGPAGAKVLRTRAEALRLAFGAEARVEPRTAFLTPAQQDSVRALAGARLEATRITYYVVTAGDSLLGTAYLDTHPVRNMPETMLVAVGADARVCAIDILAFHEPEDYLPPRRWLERLLGRSLSRRLRPGDEVDGISGATLSARAAAEAVRRVLALHRVLHGSAP